jgi:hypothetical protein
MRRSLCRPVYLRATIGQLHLFADAQGQIYALILFSARLPVAATKLHLCARLLLG